MINIGVYCKNSDDKLVDNASLFFYALNSKYNTSFQLDRITDINSLQNYDSVISFSDINFNNDKLSLYSKVSHIIDESYDFLVVSDNGVTIKSGYNLGTSGREAYDNIAISELQIERVARIAYEIAEHRENKIYSLDNSDFLESGKLWRKIVHDINEDYPYVTLSDLSSKEIDTLLKINSSLILTNKFYAEICSSLLATKLRTATHTHSYISETGFGIYFVDNKSSLLSFYLTIYDMLRNSFELYDISANIMNDLKGKILNH